MPNPANKLRGDMLVATALMSCVPAAFAAAQQSKDAEVAPHKNIAALPYARGHSFTSLDSYLDYLEHANGPIDLPWWRKVKPDLYEHMIRMPGAVPERATREQLLERFGFRH